MGKKNKKGSQQKKSAGQETAKTAKSAGSTLAAERRHHPLLSLRERIDRVFDEFTGGFPFPAGDLWGFEFPGMRALGRTLPAADLAEQDGAYRLTVELPGMEERDVEVSLSGDVLTIRGEKKEEREEKGKDRYVSERRYGAFQRAFRLPETVDRDKITASFKKGLLEIVLPKAPEAQKAQRKIPVGS
jgi:HSP20 family protein